MSCKCKEKVDKLSKYSDDGNKRKIELGAFGKIWRVLTGIIATVFLIAVGIFFAPIGIVITIIRSIFGRKTNINLKSFLKNGRQV